MDVNTQGRMNKEETTAVKLRRLESNRMNGKRFFKK